MNRKRDTILAELTLAEERLADVERARNEMLAKRDALRGELEAESTTIPRLPSEASRNAPRTPAEKVALFRSLFRGRPDIFPTRFVKKTTGKAGYAPACANKFVPNVCLLKTGGKCGECPNQAFVPVDDEVVLDHLQGRHVMGVYPLLEDETCWFLAADFDGGSWKDDVLAFAETCRSVGVPVAIERSRSGDGAHAWFFFTEPVRANVARRMGCLLITETMNRRYELGMQSYDRLFPNQDTLPRGGFGNLIALPLQHEPREQGNTVFVDERFEPLSDQWALLASISRLTPVAVEAIAREASRSGQVVGVRLAEFLDDEEEVAPWMQRPSGRARAPIAGPLPREVKAFLAQGLFIDKTGLPSPLLNQLKRLAAFQNPEFYKRQKMRLSTALTPRVISCAKDLVRFMLLPRGCLADAEALLAQNDVTLTVADEREEGERLELELHGELTPAQNEASRALLAHDTGVFVGPPGIGKTVLGTHMIAERGRAALVLVHRKPLLDQWVAQLAMFFGIDEKDIGQISGGKRKPNGRLDVAMIQSLVRKGQVDDVVARYGHVVVDECHHLPAVSFERVLAEVKARYLLGLTATPHRRDGLQPITEMHLGPVRWKIDPKSQAARRPFEHRLVVRETAFRIGTDGGESIQEIYRALANDEARNRLILDDVIAAVHEGRSPILLTERKDHLEFIADRVRPFVKQLVVLKGGMTGKERRASLDRLASIPDTAERLVLATGRYVGEGFDDARLDTLLLAMPISWKGTLIQYSGRLHRLHPAKKDVRIYDYVDRGVAMLLRMFEKRLRTYRAIGYARGESPLGFGEPTDEYVVEYDEEALRHFERDV